MPVSPSTNLCSCGKHYKEDKSYKCEGQEAVEKIFKALLESMKKQQENKQ